MERYLLFYFVILCPALWLVEFIPCKDSRSTGGWSFRLLPALIALLTLLFDARFFIQGMPAPLLAADILFLVSVFLQPFVDSRAKDFGVVVLTYLFSFVCLVRSIIAFSGRTVPFDPAVFMTVMSVFLLSVCASRDILRLSGRRRDAIQGRTDRLLTKVLCSLWLVFAGVLILACSGGSCCRAVCIALSLLLSFLYAYLYLSSACVKRAAAVPRQVASAPDKPMDKMQREEVLFRKIEEYMQREQPYLDDNLDMGRMAREMLTNKGMVSRAVNNYSGGNFCTYVNRYRIQYAVSLLKKDQRIKISELALVCGFKTVVSFNMAFRLFMNEIPSEYKRTLKAQELRKKETVSDG